MTQKEWEALGNTGVAPFSGAGYDSSGNPVTPPPDTTNPNKPKVIYNPDGTRSVVDEWWEENKPQSKADYEASQQKTKDEYAKMLQDRLSAIDSMYTGILARADETGKDRQGSGNVINALANQRGTPSGARAIDDINKYNDEIRKGILAEKQNKINSIMNENYKDQSAALEKERELRQTDLDKYLTYMGQKEQTNISKSQKMRSDLISGGINLEDIDPNTLQTMADNAGYSIDQFKALYQAEMDQNQNAFIKSEQKRLLELQKLEQEVDVKGNTDKDMVTKGYTYVKSPAERDALKKQGYEITELNGRTYAKKSAALLLAEKKQVEAKYKAPKSSTPVSNEKTAIAEMTGAINSVTGQDGFISPNDHAVLRKQWIDNGLNASTFDTKFKAYLNPNNPDYITLKQK